MLSSITYFTGGTGFPPWRQFRRLELCCERSIHHLSMPQNGRACQILDVLARVHAAVQHALNDDFIIGEGVEGDMLANEL
jgi:hypothetical protein